MFWGSGTRGNKNFTVHHHATVTRRLKEEKKRKKEKRRTEREEGNNEFATLSQASGIEQQRNHENKIKIKRH